MSTQELLVVLTLAVAVGYLCRRGWRAWGGRGGSCGGCGSGCTTSREQTAQTLIPREQLTLRVRGRR